MTIVTRKMQSRANRHMFSSSHDSTMTKHILATHAPIGRQIDVRPLLNVVEEIFHCAAPVIPGIVQRKLEQSGALKDNALQSDLSDMLAISSHIIYKISCEICSKCWGGGGDAHATSMGIMDMLSSYSWDAKAVLVLAALAVNIGEFWLVAQLFATNPLAKSVAMLKQIPKLDQVDGLGPKFEAISELLKAMLDITNCILKFQEFPSLYSSPDTPEILAVTTYVPSAVYWAIHGSMVCASQMSSIMGLGHEYIASRMETWELLSLAHKLNNINSHLWKQLTLCHRHFDNKKEREAIQTLLLLFETFHQDNLTVLKALIYNKDDQLPLFDGSTNERVSIDVLRCKIVLLYISDLNLSNEELEILKQIYSTRLESQYDIVWLPVVDKATPRTEVKKRKFENLQSRMPWYSLYDPSLLEPEAIRHIKEVWRFNKEPILVALDPQGKVVNQNSIHMMWIWGSLAYPFSSLMEEALWKEEKSWRLELLADKIDPLLSDWVSKGEYICLYGGEDLEWIRKFTRIANTMIEALQVPMHVIYMGKSNPGEKVLRNNMAILAEKLSNVLPNLTLIWFFWVRLESMWHSKLQHGKTLENDQIMKEIITILSFDGNDQGWAVICNGTEKMAMAEGDTFLKCLNDYEQWKDKAKDKGLVLAVDDYIQDLRTPHQCNRLVLPGSNDRISDKVVCAECGHPMEKFFEYRC